MKKVIALTLAFVLVLSALPVSANAADPLNPFGWSIVDSFNGLIRDMYHDVGSGIRAYWDNTGGAFLDGLLGDANDADMDAARDGYVGHVNDTIGTPIIGKTGYIVPLTVQTVRGSGYSTINNPNDTALEAATYPKYAMVATSKLGSGSNVLGGLYDLSEYTLPQASKVTLLFDIVASPVGALVGRMITYSEGNFAAGTILRFVGASEINLGSTGSGGNRIGWFRAAYLIKPLVWSVPSFTQTIGGDYSRIGNVDMTVAVTGDNNETLIAEDIKIVNETNNEYYNPVTDITSVITDWTYDYSNREYSLTLNDETTTTVRFGDDNITINEGGNVYNVYYVVPSDDDGGDGPTGPGHVHSYAVASTTPATCTVNGSKKHVCSGCGDITFEPIYASGHQWAVKQTVLTEYDNDGNLIEQGYTIYKCSECGEEYRADNGLAPPGGNDGSGDGSGGGIFETIFGIVADFLNFFGKLFTKFVGGGVKSFLGIDRKSVV